jgi:hypothetical protein
VRRSHDGDNAGNKDGDDKMRLTNHNIVKRGILKTDEGGEDIHKIRGKQNGKNLQM